MAKLPKLILLALELPIIASCLWESGFLGWLTQKTLASPGYILAEPASLIDVGGGLPNLAGFWQQGFATLFLAAGIYVLCKVTIAVLFRPLFEKRGE